MRTVSYAIFKIENQWMSKRCMDLINPIILLIFKKRNRQKTLSKIDCKIPPFTNN